MVPSKYGSKRTWEPPEGSVIHNARWAGTVVLAVIATLATAYLFLPFAAWAAVRALTLLVNGSIWAAASFSSGEDGWTIAGTMVRAAAGTFATPEASATVIALVALGAAALFGLQRLLGSEEDPSQ